MNCAECVGRANAERSGGCLQCLANGRYEPPIPASSPITVIRERIEELRREEAHARAVFTSDDGDAMSQIECEIAGLEFALRAMGVSE